MTTRGTMQARIRRELRVGTRLDADIPDAINTAIDAYRGERFHWAESRTQCVFNTVASQEFYTQTDVPALARLRSIDFVFTTIGVQPYELRQLRPDAAEWLGAGTTTGQPLRYSYYEDRIRLYPLPSGIFPIRVAGLFSVATPVDDIEANNPWMTIAERLIRCRAKAELALHRMQENELAGNMVAAAEDALSQLRRETTSRTGTGIVEPFW